MKLFMGLVCMFISLNCLADGLPSSRDKLNEEYRKAKGEYSKSQKDSVQFLKAVEGFCAVGASIVEANGLPIQKSTLPISNYPSDARRDPGKSSYDVKMRNHNNILKSFNQKISSFKSPSALSPADIRVVDQYIRTLGEAIEAHHNACLNIRH
jgi:hypothetical protein